MCLKLPALTERKYLTFKASSNIWKKNPIPAASAIHLKGFVRVSTALFRILYKKKSYVKEEIKGISPCVSGRSIFSTRCDHTQIQRGFLSTPPNVLLFITSAMKCCCFPLPMKMLNHNRIISPVTRILAAKPCIVCCLSLTTSCDNPDIVIFFYCGYLIAKQPGYLYPPSIFTSLNPSSNNRYNVAFHRQAPFWKFSFFSTCIPKILSSTVSREA